MPVRHALAEHIGKSNIKAGIRRSSMQSHSTINQEYLSTYIPYIKPIDIHNTIKNTLLTRYVPLYELHWNERSTFLMTVSNMHTCIRIIMVVSHGL